MKKNRELTEAEYEELARRFWAAGGFDPATLKARPGRPSISDAPGAHSPRIRVRVSPAVKQIVAAKAAAEGKTISEVARRLLEDYVQSPPSSS
jgi:hypothetical protein